VTAGGALVCACLVLTPGGWAVAAVLAGGFDPWESDCPVRDLSGLVVPLAGAVAVGGPGGVPFFVVFGADERAARAVNAYLRDLHETFARPLTLRSYAYDLLRWLRFLAAVGVGFDEAVRSDYGDFLRWLGEHGKTGGARRARRDPGGVRLNRVTGKLAPDERWFDPATLAHSRIVLHEFYEFLLDRGSRPVINPVPHSRRRDLGQFRQHPHHNPMQPFAVRRAGRRRFDPPDAKTVPRHLPDEQFERLWSELCCDRDRAMAKVSVDCGVRPGELLGMRGEDLDWGGALIHVVRKGGRKAQWLPVSRDAIAWIRRYQAASGYVAGPGDPLWVTSRSPRRPVGYGAWRAVFSRVNQRLGTNWTPHDLRHTACVRMIEAGMKLHQVQEIMGHEDLATTRRYLRPRLDELIEAQREAQARPLPRPSGPGIYDQADLDTLFGRDLR
jgi:integrase/recombinase XerD